MELKCTHSKFVEYTVVFCLRISHFPTTFSLSSIYWQRNAVGLACFFYSEL